MATRKRLQKLFALLLVLSMTMGMLNITAFAEGEGEEGHVHSSACGYVEAVEGKPCNHVHDEACGYQEGVAEVPCNMDCTDDNGDGTIDHQEGCTYTPAVEEKPCTHSHDESCGYVEAVAGHPCAVESVIALIDALPATITEEDREAVEAARAAYDALEESLQADVTNYDVLVAAEEALEALEPPQTPDYVAQIGDTKYKTLAEAAAAAKSGDTITLLADIFEENGVGIFANGTNTAESDGVLDLTIDMAGHTLYCIIKETEPGISANLYTTTSAPEYKMGTLTIRNGTFKGVDKPGYKINSAISCTGNLVMENCVVENATAKDHGAVTVRNVVHGVSVTLKQCTFRNNSVPKTGALCVEHNVKTILDGVEFVDNYAGWYGAALYITSEDRSEKGSVEIKNCKFVGNEAAFDGGAVYIGPNQETVLTDNEFTDNHGGRNGGAIHIMESSTAIQSCEFTNNSAVSNGGAIYTYNGTVTTQDSNFTGNHADENGGALYSSNSTVEINGDLTNNTAGGNGGAVCMYQYKLDLTGNMTGNTAGGNGGALFSVWSVVDLNGDISGNSAVQGGGIYTAENTFGSVYDGKINLLEATVRNNGASDAGADIWQGNGNQMELKNVGEDWTLTECSHAIDGWYYDAQDNRWSESSRQKLEATENEGAFQLVGEAALKAAHGAISSGGGGSSYDYYTVTVNYLDKDSGEKIAQSYVSGSIREGRSYDVTAYDAIAIEGYAYDSTTGDPLTGTMNGNKVINVWYVAEDTDITDPEVPGGELPENSDGGDGTDPGVDIEDPDVPGAEVPETGDISALWLALSALSGTGLAGVTLLGRKKRDEE